MSLKNLINKNNLITLIGLLLLQYFIDFAFVYIYPTVNPIRASFVGLSALAILSTAYFITKEKSEFVNPVIGALTIFSSAFFGALLVQAGYLLSKSAISGAIHIIILIVSYFILDFVYEKIRK